MKIAVLSESPADEAAISILADAIVGMTTTLILLEGNISLRRSWPGVRSDLPAVLRYLHYRTDADFLVMVVDSNGSPAHQSQHPPTQKQRRCKCRLCELDGISSATLSTLKPVPNRSKFRVAIGLAVPAIEAWLLCGQKGGFSETMLKKAPAGGRRRLDMNSWKKKLKRQLYKTNEPSLEDETKLMIHHATKVSQRLDLLRRHFPHGFGSLENALRQQ